MTGHGSFDLLRRISEISREKSSWAPSTQAVRAKPTNAVFRKDKPRMLSAAPNGMKSSTLAAAANNCVLSTGEANALTMSRKGIS